VNRFGWGLAILFLTFAAAFALLVRNGQPVAPPPILSLQKSAAEEPGRFTIPVAGVRPEQLVDSYADARGERTHGALDIMAPRGALVVAAAPGTVEKIFESEAGGHTVYIRTDGGRWMQYYAHLDRYADGLHEGMQVTRGQIIGTVGSTGNADPEGPHLHFELKRMAPGEAWHQGRAINPYPLLAPARPAR